MESDLFPVDLDIALLRERIHRLIDVLAIGAHIAIDREAEFARRSVGQRFRRVREFVEGVNHGSQ